MQTSNQLRGDLVDNTTLTNIASASAPMTSCDDPWTRAHMRVCAHASDHCAACSIALVCCSCRALRYTPGPPPPSPLASHPILPTQRSRSASPALFRNVGNGPPPPGYDTCDDHPPHDDNAYSRALAECDTCDNMSCPRGHDEPATYSIVVEHFDEGSEEFYDRTFRACSACNRSCKKSFMGYRIKSRTFDNSVRESLNRTPTALNNSSKITTAVTDPVCPTQIVPITSGTPDERCPLPIGIPATTDSRPTASTLLAGPPSLHTDPPHPASPGIHMSSPSDPVFSPAPCPPTPLEVFSTVSYAHRVSCSHPFATCPTCCNVSC